jgi:ubiquinone/menaquinone biosynthesis C-methylase UbiE
MNVQATDAQIEAALVYERLFVPAEFREWARHLATAAQLRPGERVLDVACGTGVVAREVLDRVGPTGEVSGLDADPGMVTVASRLAPQVQYRQGVAESLPFSDSSFDAVLCQFGLMFFSDRVAALKEMVRVLRPGGRIAVAVWDTLENTPAYDGIVKLLRRVAGERAAAALTAPFALGDKSDVARLFESAGIAEAKIATAVGRSRFPAIRTMVEADLRGWLPVMGVSLPEAQIEQILREAEQVLSSYRVPSGEVHFDSPAHVVTAMKR